MDPFDGYQGELSNIKRFPNTYYRLKNIQNQLRPRYPVTAGEKAEANAQLARLSVGALQKKVEGKNNRLDGELIESVFEIARVARFHYTEAKKWEKVAAGREERAAKRRKAKNGRRKAS